MSFNKMGLTLRYILWTLGLLCAGATANAKETKVFAVEEPPAAYINENLDQDGYVLDIFKAMQARTGLTSRVMFIPEARALNILAEEPNCMLMSISRTPARESRYIWIAHVMSKKWEVYTLTRSHMRIDSINALMALPSIGVVRGDIREEWLIGLNFSNLNSVTQHRQNIEMLKLGRVNAIVYEQQGLIYQAKALGLHPEQFKSVFTLNQAPVYIVMSLNSDPQLVALWQEAFVAIVNNGQLHMIAERWQRQLQQLNINSELHNNVLVF